MDPLLPSMDHTSTAIPNLMSAFNACVRDFAVPRNSWNICFCQVPSLARVLRAVLDMSARDS